jgi:hypothetical protein
MEDVCEIDVIIGGEKTQDELYDLVRLEVLNLQNQETDTKIKFLVSGYDSMKGIQELKENELEGYVTFLLFFCVVVHSEINFEI